MKSILGLVIFVSCLASGRAVALPELQSSFIASREVEEYTSDIPQNIHKTFKVILNISLDRQTLENAFYLRGTSEEKNSSTTDLSVLNLKSGSFQDQALDVVQRILSVNADIACIGEIFADDDVYDLYEVLQNDYAHFIYIPPMTTLNLRENNRDSGLLVASKFEIIPVRSKGDNDSSSGGGKVGGELKCEWGGPDGMHYSASFHAEVYDGNGNYMEATVEQYSSGEGSAAVSGGREEERD